MNARLPSLIDAKAQARRLRAELAARGEAIGHSDALERIARQLGYRDWNTLHATIGNRRPEGWTPGGRVRGSYMSRPFEATVRSAQMLRPGWVRLVLDLDEAVDVVVFESFSNYRKRIRGTVGPAGTSREKTSDGVPHLVVEI